MLEVRQTETFAVWLRRLRDVTARARILVRIRRAEVGNLGDVRSLGDGVSEMRIDHGPGYRVYFVCRGEALIILMCGGDKRSQQKDILRAKQMAREV